jgi:uncharacterized repeat protein (TIGR02543 family)
LFSVFLLFVITGCRIINFGNNPDVAGNSVLKGKVVVTSNPSSSLRASGSVSATQPAANASVWLESFPSKKYSTDSEGNYSITGLPPGKYKVVGKYIKNGTTYLMRSKPQSVESDEVAESDLLILFEATNFVKGKLKDEDGNPLRTGTELSLWGIKFMIESDDGSFKTPALPELEGLEAINNIIVRPQANNRFVIPVSFVSAKDDEISVIEAVVPSSPSLNSVPVVSIIGLFEDKIKTKVDAGQKLELKAFVSPKSAEIESWSASDGELGPIIMENDGSYKRTWTAPEQGANPAVITIKVVNQMDQGATAHLRIPVKGAFKVSFDSNGGTEINSRRVLEGEKLSEPQEPSREGYNFKGWYKDKEFQSKWNFATDMVEDNLTLFARWSKKSSVADIESLIISEGELSPSFSSEVTSYEVKLDFSVTRINLLVSATSELAAIEINGKTSQSTASTTLSLSEYVTELSVKVIAEDLSEKTYSITFKRIAQITAIADISGTPDSGETLTAGALTPADATVDYQWQMSDDRSSGWSDIADETAETYTVDLNKSPAGKYVRVVATGIGNYTGIQQSSEIEINAIEITAIADTSGTPASGETLTAGDLTPAEATVDYQWQMSDDGRSGWSDIVDETAETYTVDLNKTSEGKFVRVVATGKGNYTGVQQSTAVQICIEWTDIVFGNQIEAYYSQNIDTLYLTGSGAMNDFGFRVNSGKLQHNGSDIKNLVITDDITSIGNYAFYDNSLTSLTIPDSVTSIGIWAFTSNSLASLTIPNSVTSIADRAFYYNDITSLTIPDSVTSIGDYAFYGNSLESVKLGNSVESIGEAAFASNSIASLPIPDNVTSIERHAFNNNSLTSVTIGSGLTSIETGVFSYNSLTEVTIPDNVTSIEDYAFSQSDLATITIGSGVAIGANVSMGTYTADFKSLYDGNGKSSGTYNYVAGSWSKQ